VDQYKDVVVGLVSPLKTESVPLAQGLGRVLARDCEAVLAVPSFDNSAMDGYAVRTEDVRGGQARLRLIGTLLAGPAEEVILEPGTAMKIMTGAVIPVGAVTVVPVEDIVVSGVLEESPQDWVHIAGPVPEQHIRRRGEDTLPGAVVISAGTRLDSADLGAAAAVGHSTIVVRSIPRVGLLTTGDETVEPGSMPSLGQIPDSNTAYLVAALTRLGAQVTARHVPDCEEDIRLALDDFADTQDLIITVGGISAGDRDLVRDLLQDTGILAKVAMQPGKPQGCGTWRNTPLLALPGNPVSVAASTSAFVRPVLEAMTQVNPSSPWHARVAQTWVSPGGREQYMPVVVECVNGCLEVRPATQAGSGSHLITSLAKADAFALIPADVTHVESGEVVRLMALP
jgi:molybdopterin molybdotransferase